MADEKQGMTADKMADARKTRNDEDSRSDIEQMVEARSDAIERGEGGPEPETFTETGLPDGPAGTGGITKNQRHDAQ